jgi:hypothetical protein
MYSIAYYAHTIHLIYCDSSFCELGIDFQYFDHRFMPRILNMLVIAYDLMVSTCTKLACSNELVNRYPIFKNGYL